MQRDEKMTSMNDIRAILSDEVSKIRNGDTTASNVNAIVNATGKILSTIKLEIEYNRLLGKTPNISFMESK
jgi:hypothetical protein